MRKILYIINALLITLLASCSKDLAEDTTTGTQGVTIYAAADFALANGATALQTRAVATIDRYMIEVYTDAACADAANVFTASTTHKATNESGVFTMVLDKGQTYYCLLWADNGASDVYDVTDLKAVSLKTGATPVEGFYGKLTISEAKPTYDIALHRAVACVLLQEKGTLPAGTLMAKFSQKTTFDVSSATTSGNAVERIESITVSAGITGTAETPAVIGNPIYLLAPTAASEKVSFTFQYASNAEFSVADVPIQANFNSKITGSFNNDVNFTAAKVGDFYMKDGTWLPGATTLTTTQQADCIGIVYWTGDPTVNDDALKSAHPTCTNGLVVALKDSETSTWQTTMSDVNAWTTANTTYAPIASGENFTDPINKIMGYNNTKAIEMFNAATANSANKVDWIDKVVAYRTAVPTPMGNSGWFLPSTKELTLLCGLSNQDANVFDDNYGTGNRDAINTQLAKISGSTQITMGVYWSSTQDGVNVAWTVYFSPGYTNYGYKDANGSVRVVSAF